MLNHCVLLRLCCPVESHSNRESLFQPPPTQPQISPYYKLFTSDSPLQSGIAYTTGTVGSGMAGLGSNMTPKGSQKGSQNGAIFRSIFEVLFKTPLRPTWGPKGLPKHLQKWSFSETSDLPKSWNCHQNLTFWPPWVGPNFGPLSEPPSGAEFEPFWLPFGVHLGFILELFFDAIFRLHFRVPF